MNELGKFALWMFCCTFGLLFLAVGIIVALWSIANLLPLAFVAGVIVAVTSMLLLGQSVKLL